MSEKGTSYFTVAVVLLVMAALGWLAYTRVFQDQEAHRMVRPGAGPVAVHVAAVSTGTVRELRTFPGTLIPRAQFIVAPKIAGRLERLYVDVGDPVRRDQLVARLDDAEFIQQAEQAKAELAVARANVEEARSDLDIAEKEFMRIQSLFGQGVTHQAELDLVQARRLAQQARLKVAVSQVDQRIAALRAAEVRLGYTQVRATWPENDHDRPRVVGERFVDEGATLSANAQMLSVLDIEGLRAVFHVTEQDYLRLRPGQFAVIALDALPGRRFEARLSRMAPVFREASRQARVELEIDNPEDLLKPGMFVKATLELDRAENVVLAPVAALVRRNGLMGVFLVDEDHKARHVQVRIGIVEGNLAQVLEPADLSGNVVVLGQHLLEDGSAVRVIEDEPSPVDPLIPEP